MTEPEPCALCEDAAFLLLSGEDIWTVAPRICVRGGKRHRCGPGQGCRPMQARSLVSHLHRHGRDDLVPVGAWSREVTR